MLTEIQLKNLQPLTNHKKYGSLVKAAIIGWKKCKPASGSFGLQQVDGKFKRSSYSKGCCFLGATCVNRKTKSENWITEYFYDKFKITHEEFWDLSDGFETNDNYIKSTSAFKFGQKVRKALGEIIMA